MTGVKLSVLDQSPIISGHTPAQAVHETLICLLKTHEDRARLTREVTDRLLGKVA